MALSGPSGEVRLASRRWGVGRSVGRARIVTSSSPRKPGDRPIEIGRRPSPDSVFVAKAPSGEIVFSNRYAERVVGRRLSEIADDFPMFHLDGRPYSFAERQVPRSLSSGEEIVDEEFFGSAADGSRVCYRCSCWPVYDDGGEIVAAVALTRDVTEQKRQEERLTYLASLLENTEDAVVALDERYFLTVWNKGAERLYGWSAEEVVGRHANEVARTNLSEEERAELRRELAGNGRWRGEVAVARKDGTTVDVELISVALRGQQRDITGYLAIHRDISERKRTEEALREAQRRSETILESISDAFVAVDREWRYTYLNERALVGARIALGEELTSADLLGKNCWEAFPELVDTTFDEQLHTALGEHKAVQFEAYSPRIESWLEVHAYPSKDGLSVYSRDVSERKRAEERFSEVREAERRRIARDLHDDALQELTDALVQADRGRSAGLGPEAAGQLVSSLKRVGQQLRGAIYDLRLSDDVGRPFPEALGALVDVHRALAVECEIGLDVSWETSTSLVGNRGVEVLRIVGEALTNARRHSGARNVRVSARGSDGSICVEVTDDGRGVDPDAAASGIDGMGIKGMHERAALLGGDLDIRSAPGTGTTIHFEFGPPQHDEPPTTTARILLVEDHAAVRQAIAGMFEQQADLDVVGQAGSLADAREMLQDVDVAVVDLGLPDGYGGDLISELRDVNPRAQALVLSASLDPVEVARAIDMGAAVTLDKTANLDQLVDTVRRLHRGAAPPS
jgi:PAS domain S-box-containing protein